MVNRLQEDRLVPVATWLALLRLLLLLVPLLDAALLLPSPPLLLLLSLLAPPMHADKGTRLDVEVLARIKGGEGDGTIVAVRQGSLLATAFHPELTGDLRVHALFVEMARAAAR